MKIKEIKKNGVFCWSPSKAESSLAIATTSQQFDTNFGTDCKLEIYNLDIDKFSEEAKLCASIVNSNTFNCIVWHPKELICGTQVKNLQIYSLKNEGLKLEYESEAHSSSVTCLDLNAYELNSLAAGCDDGTIGVWDLDNSGILNKTLSLSSTATANEPISCVRWNKQVSSILAAASNSNVHVWDTRKSINSGPIMRVHDTNATNMWGSGPQSLMICRSLAWSHSQATSLILANSNDANPILQLWDLRYATCPLNHFKGGHSRGIVSISWNKYDEELLLSAGKDNTVCLWNPLIPLNEEPLQAVIPYITNQWINEVEWCHWEPSLFAISSFDGNTSVYNLTQTNSLNQTNTKILESFSLNSQHIPSQQIQPSMQRQPILTKAPKWLRSPCRASWGFGGKLISYNTIVTQTQTQPPTQFTQHLLTIQQVVTDSELIERSEKLENALNNGNFMDYCLYKMSEHTNSENILMAWKLVALHLENDPQKQRETLLNLLGFDNNGKQSKDSVGNLCDLTNNQLSIHEMANSQNINTVNNGSNETEFFSQENIVNLTKNQTFMNNLNIDTSNACLGTQINRAILKGNLQSVINNCICNNNWAEAILMCCFVAPEHTASTINKYFQYCLTSKSESWSSLLWCIISAQTASDDEAVQIFQELVANVELKYWREVLAFVVRESENWEEINTKTFLIDTLAKRLIQYYSDSGQMEWLNAAMFCFIINADYVNLSKFLPFGNRLDQIELSLILQKSTNTQFAVNELTAYYAKLLAIDGKLELALKYIDDNEVELRERIIGNLRPTVRRHSSHTQAVAPRVQKPVQSINRHAMQATAFPYDSASSVQYTPAMPSPYNVVQNEPRITGHSFPPPSVAAVPNAYSLVNQSTTGFTAEPYVPPNYEEQQQSYSHPMTPGWNDPPVITNSRHNSFSAQRIEPHQPLAPIFNPIPGNRIETPLPYVEQHQPLQSNTKHSSLTKQQSLPPPSEPLSPQNQKIYESFERLLSQLQQNLSSQPLNMRRKLDDARVKLETLKSKLSSESQLSSNTLMGLSDIANAINCNDFQSALQYHTNLVASTTFGETATFLPAIKVILHLAQQKIYN